jgi:hypothetical protein
MLAIMTWLFLCMANNLDLNMHDFTASSEWGLSIMYWIKIVDEK